MKELEVFLSSGPPSTSTDIADCSQNDASECSPSSKKGALRMNSWRKKQPPVDSERREEQSCDILGDRPPEQAATPVLIPNDSNTEDCDNESFRSLSMRSWLRNSTKSFRSSWKNKGGSASDVKVSNKGKGRSRLQSKLRSFRWKRARNSPRTPVSNNEVVIDLCSSDVQSVSSAPDMIGSRRVRLWRPNPTENENEDLETRSVMSFRSIGSFSFRRKAESSDSDDISLGTEFSNSEQFSPGSSMTNPRPDQFTPSVAGSCFSPAQSSPNWNSRHKKNQQSLLRRIFKKSPRPERARYDENTHDILSFSFNSGELSLDSSEFDTELALANDSGPREISNEPAASVDRRPPHDRWSPVSFEISTDPQGNSSSPPRVPRRSYEPQNFSEPSNDESKTENDSEDVCLPSSQNEIAVDSTDIPKNRERIESDDGSVVSLLSGLLTMWATRSSSERMLSDEDKNDSVCNTALSLRSCLKRSSDSQVVCARPLRSRHSVCFTVVQVREYERTVGDNPSCTKGPPISLGWAYYQITPDINVEVYSQRPKRTKRQFHLPPGKRNNLLVREWEVPEEDIRKARREATYIQYCRERTAPTGFRIKEASYLRKANQKQTAPDAGQEQGKQSNSSIDEPPKVRCQSLSIYVPPRSPTSQRTPLVTTESTIGKVDI